MITKRRVIDLAERVLLTFVGAFIAVYIAAFAAGQADITFTLVPKHEWDVAGGAALVASAGGCVRTRWNTELICNRKDPRMGGLIACGPFLQDQLLKFLSPHLQPVGGK